MKSEKVSFSSQNKPPPLEHSQGKAKFVRLKKRSIQWIRKRNFCEREEPQKGRKNRFDGGALRRNRDQGALLLFAPWERLKNATA